MHLTLLGPTAVVIAYFDALRHSALKVPVVWPSRKAIRHGPEIIPKPAMDGMLTPVLSCVAFNAGNPVAGVFTAGP